MVLSKKEAVEADDEREPKIENTVLEMTGVHEHVGSLVEVASQKAQLEQGGEATTERVQARSAPPATTEQREVAMHEVGAHIAAI